MSAKQHRIVINDLSSSNETIARPFPGEVVGYDAAEKLYRIRYEDGDEEEMDEAKLGNFAVSAASVIGALTDASENEAPDSSEENEENEDPTVAPSSAIGEDALDLADDIDRRDDALCVAPYAADIFDHFRATEALVPLGDPHDADAHRELVD